MMKELFRHLITELLKYIFLPFAIIRDSRISEFVGIAIREGYYKVLFKYQGKNVRIGKGIIVKGGQNISIGSRVMIENNVFFRSQDSKSEIVIGNDVRIESGTQIDAGGGWIVIGDRTSFNANCYLHGAGGIKIGSDVLVSPHVVIISSQHTYSNPTVKIYDQPEIIKKVLIEDDVWIGSNAVILPGISIGKGSVIGANAVVNTDIAPYSVAVGIPAKVIKHRGTV